MRWNIANELRLNSREIVEITNNINLIRQHIDKMILIRDGLTKTGQSAGWICLAANMMSKAGAMSILAKATSSLGWVTVGTTVIQAGADLKSWYSGQITGQKFWQNTS